MGGPFSHIAKSVAARLALPVISHIELILTTRCNLRCKYCFQTNSDRSRDMSEEIGKKALEKLIESRLPMPQSLIMFGGEPFLQWELFKNLVCYARTLRSDNLLYVSTVTNATIIPADAPGFCKEQDIEVMVSLDLGQEAHDRYRVEPSGTGSYEMALEGIRLLTAAGVDVVVRTTVTPGRLTALIDTYRLCRDLGVKTWFISRVTGMEWSEEDVDELETGYAELSALYQRDIAKDPMTMSVAQLNHMATGKILDECGAGKSNLSVDPEGNLHGCSRLATTSETGGTYCLGALSGGLNAGVVRKLRDTIDSAGCPAINLDETGSVGQISSQETRIRNAFLRLQNDLMAVPRSHTLPAAWKDR